MHIKSLTKSQVFPFGLVCFFLVFQMIANIVRATPESLAPLVETVSPAVVNITTSTTVAAPVGPQGLYRKEVLSRIFFVTFKIVMGAGVLRETHPP